MEVLTDIERAALYERWGRFADVIRTHPVKIVPGRHLSKVFLESVGLVIEHELPLKSGGTDHPRRNRLAWRFVEETLGFSESGNFAPTINGVRPSLATLVVISAQVIVEGASTIQLDTREEQKQIFESLAANRRILRRQRPIRSRGMFV